MGEYQHIVDSAVRVNDEQAVLDEALELMEHEDELGKGYSSRNSNHFSWLNNAEPEKWATGFDALADWRFPLVEEVEGEWTEFNFTGEKVGQEELLFQQIKPYVDGFIELHTDYGRDIRYEFGDTPRDKRDIDNSVVTYPECAEWLEENYPEDVTIRAWSNGDLSLYMDAADMDGYEEWSMDVENIPGDWTIESVVWAEKGIQINLTRAINLSETFNTE